MKANVNAQAKAMERDIESALSPGSFIDWRGQSSFISDLESVKDRIEILIRPASALVAADLFETFLAGCFAKAEEVDDSDGELGEFVDALFVGWLRARQVGKADPAETAVHPAERVGALPAPDQHLRKRQAVPTVGAGLAACGDVGIDVPARATWSAFRIAVTWYPLILRASRRACLPLAVLSSSPRAARRPSSPSMAARPARSRAGMTFRSTWEQNP